MATEVCAARRGRFVAMGVLSIRSLLVHCSWFGELEMAREQSTVTESPENVVGQ